ncbi:MAG: hypothetical protein JWP52_2718 [Rhizobacter sp.]|jgi:hypothetical protein|nr:hypothetical protein [Rhizobacter sp.]
MSDANVPARTVAIVGVVIAVTVACAIGVVVALLHHSQMPLGGDRVPPGGSNGWLHIEGATLESAPQQDLKAYLAAKRQRLESTGWVDREQGIAHIPIEAAMGLISRQGEKP